MWPLYTYSSESLVVMDTDVSSSLNQLLNTLFMPTCRCIIIHMYIMWLQSHWLKMDFIFMHVCTHFYDVLHSQKYWREVKIWQSSLIWWFLYHTYTRKKFFNLVDIMKADSQTATFNSWPNFFSYKVVRLQRQWMFALTHSWLLGAGESLQSYPEG